MPPDDALRAALDSVFAAPEYQWVERPQPLRLLREWIGRLTDWVLALRDGNPLLFRLLVAALVVVLLAVLAHAAWVFYLTVRGATHADGPGRPAPAVAVRDADWYRRSADAAAGDGRFPEALRLAFGALALQLDAAGALSYAPGKTPGDYAREARLAATDRRRLAELVAALYRHVYGGVPCGVEDYERWRGDARREWHAAAA